MSSGLTFLYNSRLNEARSGELRSRVLPVMLTEATRLSRLAVLTGDISECTDELASALRIFDQATTKWATTASGSDWSRLRLTPSFHYRKFNVGDLLNFTLGSYVLVYDRLVTAVLDADSIFWMNGPGAIIGAKAELLSAPSMMRRMFSCRAAPHMIVEGVIHAFAAFMDDHDGVEIYWSVESAEITQAVESMLGY
jgi:hypothetical protein